MLKLAMIYCECGHRIWYEVRPEEEDLATVVFFDLEEETGDSHAGRITRCPECATRPIELLLNARYAVR